MVLYGTDKQWPTRQYVSEVTALQMGVGRRRQGVIPVRQTTHYTSVTQWSHWEHQREGRRQGAKGRTQTGDGHWHT